MPIGNKSRELASASRFTRALHDGPVEPVDHIKVGKRNVSMIKPNPVTRPNQYEIGIPSLGMETNFSVIRIEDEAAARVVFGLIVADLQNGEDAVKTMEQAHRLVSEFEAEQPELPTIELD